MHTTDTPLGRHINTVTHILDSLDAAHVVDRCSDAYIITADMRSAHIFVDQDGLILTTIVGEDLPAADWMDGEISPEQTAIALSPDSVAARIVSVADDGGYTWDSAYSGDLLSITIETPEAVEIVIDRGAAHPGRLDVRHRGDPPPGYRGGADGLRPAAHCVALPLRGLR